MGSSAFDPVALADVRSVKNKIDMAGITSDVLTVGDVIRYDASTDTFLRAMANNETNANFVGVIESVDSTNFVVVYSGEISLPDSLMSTIAGSTTAQIFYLSDTNPGKLTTTSPSNPGSVIKPVIITTGTVDGNPTSDSYLGSIDGIVVNSIGSRISGDSTVDLSDIQPVGTVSAFAGNTGQIPTGWDICDGGFLSISTYGDLYTALNSGKIYGFIESLTLNRVSNSGSGFLTSSNIVGSEFYITRSGNPEGIRCTVLSGTVDDTGTQVTNVEAFVHPTYVNGPQVGQYHDSELLGNFDQGRFYIGTTPLDVVYSIASPTKTKFKKPDLRARFVIGSSKGITGVEDSAFNTYTIGNVGGEEEHLLTATEMPIHNHGIGFTSSISANLSTSFNLQTDPAGAHTHTNIGLINNVKLDLTGTNSIYSTSGVPLPNAGQHSHTVIGNINVGATNLEPNIDASITNAGGNLAHNNVPQHMVLYWIIKTRKDSYAKILRLGPSGGGAVIGKNTPKKWARSSSGAGCTVDISYGTWGVSRLGQGNYLFTHNMVDELGTTNADKYIVEATVNKNSSGLTQMFVANPYGYTGVTFGVQVYDIIGTTHSDHFQYLNITVYGGGTAL